MMVIIATTNILKYLLFCTACLNYFGIFKDEFKDKCNEIININKENVFIANRFFI